jgi:fructoselysine-6-P-deglycase FrlB-like protein
VGKAYSDEIMAIPETLHWAARQEIGRLQKSTCALAGRSVVAVGSGGSYTAASYVAGLHERKYRKLSRAATPLDVVCGPQLQECSAIYLSAEGRNADILAAVGANKGAETGSIALTLVPGSPLAALCESSGCATSSEFDIPWKKDGYLATNTLLAMMALFARAYANVDIIAAVQIDVGWLDARRREFSESSVIARIGPGTSLIALHGAAGKVAAIDLESKFAESALGPCQPVDFRQFAHGRHLQLVNESPPVVIAFGSLADAKLMDAGLKLVPESVPMMRIDLPEDYATAEIVGVVYAMLIVEAVSKARGVDVGQPEVPQFGRDMYATDVREFVAKAPEPISSVLRHKVPKLCPPQVDVWTQAADGFIGRLESATFKGIVCDFDGTCCYTPKRWDGLERKLIDQFRRLISGGIKLAFATGRGRSIQGDLRAKLPEELHAGVMVGYYSGSKILYLDEDVQELDVDPRFNDLETWLAEHGIAALGSDDVKARCGQMSIRLSGALSESALTSAITYWLTQVGHIGWRVFCSGHSVDVLNEHAGKRLVVDRFSSAIAADPTSEVLRIGDAGNFTGNDFELLSDGLGLSVARVSPLRQSCWNLLPDGLHGAGGTLHYLAALEVNGGQARLSQVFIEEVRTTLKNTGPVQ